MSSAHRQRAGAARARERRRARRPEPQPDVEQPRPRRAVEVGAHGRGERAPVAQPPVHEAEVAPGCAAPPRRARPRRAAPSRWRAAAGGRSPASAELEQRELGAEAGAEGAQHARARRAAGGRSRRISSRTNSTVTELMFPCSASTASVAARSPRVEAELLAHDLDDAAAAGMQDPARHVLAGRPQGRRGSRPPPPTTSRRTNGARPRSRTICRPCVPQVEAHEVGGAGEEDALRVRAPAPARSRGARDVRRPTSTTAAPPSPKIAVETTLVAERSQRWKVRLENSSASTRAARSGWAAR